MSAKAAGGILFSGNKAQRSEPFRKVRCRSQACASDLRAAEPCRMSPARPPPTGGCKLFSNENGIGNAELVEYLDEHIVLLDPANRPHAYPEQSLFG